MTATSVGNHIAASRLTVDVVRAAIVRPASGALSAQQTDLVEIPGARGLFATGQCLGRKTQSIATRSQESW
jgi:hypothetical protein